MNFSKALELLKQGKKIKRTGWNGKNQYLELATCISYKNLDGKVINPNHICGNGTENRKQKGKADRRGRGTQQIRHTYSSDFITWECLSVMSAMARQSLYR
jgi:hypothetical protein